MNDRRVLVVSSLIFTAGQCMAQSVAQNDIAVGWSQTNLDNTIQLFSAPTGSPPLCVLKTDPWNQAGFIEFPVWDNDGGLQHNPNGHMLGLDFGTTAGGLQLFYYPSGTSAAVAAPLFNSGSAPSFGSFSSLTISRGGGIAVSPDNTKMAVGGYDSGQVLIFTYNAATGAVTDATQTQALPTVFNAHVTPGVGWLNNTTVLLFGPGGPVAPGTLNLSTIDTSDPSLPVVQQAVLPFLPTGLSESCGLAYSPLVTPYIYVSYSTFTGTGGTPPNTSFNKLFVVDPRTTPWSTVKTVDLSTSANTLRGIALDSHGNLFISQFAGSGAVPTIQELVGASNPANLTDNSSVVVYTDNSGAIVSNFAYLDVAQGVGNAPTCYANCDQSSTPPILNVADFTCFLQKYAAGDPYANCDASTVSPILNVADFTCFLQKYAAGCP